MQLIQLPGNSWGVPSAGGIIENVTRFVPWQLATLIIVLVVAGFVIYLLLRK